MKASIKTLILPVTVVTVLVALIAGSAISCTQQGAETGRIGVAVTILPQAEFVEAVGGYKVEITVMVPPGASPHTYEPTPSQMVALSRAQLYAKVGSGVEFELAWMDKLIAQNKSMLVIDCSQGVHIRAVESACEHEHEGHDHEHEHEHEGHNHNDNHDHGHNHDHDHGALDPHIWMSPRNAQIMVQNIAGGLIQIDPDNRAYYEQNRDAYLEKLSQLDRDISGGLSNVKNRKFMVYHPAFGYFASDYNLTMLAIEAAGKEPTPAGLQRLIEQAKEHDIRVVFASPQFNQESAEVIARAIGGKVILISPLARDYVENLRSLMDELVQAME